METSIELGYAGVVIGRVTVTGEVDESSLFLPVPDPLPVGTRINLKIDGRAAEGRVLSVTETAEPGKAGMRVRVGPVSVVTAPVPEPAAPRAPAPAVTSGANAAPSAPAPAVSSDAVPGTPVPATPSGASAGLGVPVVAAPETSEPHADGAGEGGGDGVPAGDDVGGNSGPNAGGGGGRRRRRRR